MVQRVPWDMSEAIIMLDALIATCEGQIARKDAIESVSSRLRDRAEKNGIVVDDVFRNINGITLQMSTMEYILTDGKKGMQKASMPKLFQAAVAMYRNDRATYEKMLRKAKNMLSIESIKDQYFAWLATQVSPTQLSELHVAYADIEEFCLNRSIVKKKLFELTNLSEIRRVVDTVDSNKVFRFAYRKNSSKMSTAIHFYYRFMKENLEPVAQATAVKAASAPKLVVEKPVNCTLESITWEEKQRNLIVKNAIKVVDFTSIDSLAFTQPIAFLYFGEEQAKVCSWTQLYVAVIHCLLDDYPDTLLTYINCNICGLGRYDFADETSVRSMTAPKKLQDSLYLETNISASDIVSKIRKLLDLCNVDYENLEIQYQGRDSAAAASVPEAASSNSKKTEIDYNRTQFLNWMKQAGAAIGTIRSYLSAIGQSGKSANEYGICNEDLFLIEDTNRLKQILDNLLDVPAFWELNEQQHNRFCSAVSKLITYRSNKPSTIVNAQQRLMVSSENETAMVNAPMSLPSETRTRYVEILAECFGEDGYQPGRAISHGRFKYYYAEKYSCDPAESDECIDSILGEIGTERDGRIFPKQDDSHNHLIADIVNDILSVFNAGVTAVYIEAVFDKYQQSLAEDLHIYNHETLASLLLSQANGKFTQRYSYLVNNLSKVNVQEDLLDIMKSFHQPQCYTVIHEKAWFIPYNKMKNILVTTCSIVSVAQATYFYAPNLPVSNDELVHLSALMHDELSYHSHITDVRLMELIAEKCPSIAINTDGYTTYGLRNCLGYILRDQFAINGPIITLKGHELNMADVYGEFAKNHEALHVDELSDLSNEMNIVIYWDSVLSEMIRVSATELVRKDQIKFDVMAIDKILDDMCPGDYIPLQDVNLFLHFPNIGYPWNSYLLESYLFNCSKKFRLLHSSFIKTGVYGAMVRADASIQNYRTMLVDVLSKSNALGSIKAALQYIVDKGYQQRRRYEGIESVVQEAKLIKERRENQEK